MPGEDDIPETLTDGQEGITVIWETSHAVDESSSGGGGGGGGGGAPGEGETPPTTPSGISGAVVFGSGTGATKAEAKAAAILDAKAQCGGDAVAQENGTFSRGGTDAPDGGWSCNLRCKCIATGIA